MPLSTEATMDRPARAIEHAIQRTNDLAMQYDNARHRLQQIAERLVHGTKTIAESNPPSPVEHGLPELSELGSNLDRLDTTAQLIMEAVNVLEGV